MEISPESGIEGPQQPLPNQEQQEQVKVGEMLLRRDYQSSMTIIGEDRIRNIKEAVEVGDYNRLEREINKALPLAEGLEFGIYSESYGIPEKAPNLDDLSETESLRAQVKDNNVYSKMRNLFLTVEDSIDRGNVGYLRDAMLDSLSRPIRELEEWDEDEGQTWEDNISQKLVDSYNHENFQRITKGENPLSVNEIEDRIKRAIEFQKEQQKAKMERIREKREDLLALDLHLKSRFTIDNAFRQRQYVSHDRDLQSNMKQSVGLGTAEPDGTHFQGFYQVNQEWGEAVDRVEREFVRMGMEGVLVDLTDGNTLKTDGIFTGNPNTKQFKKFIDNALEASKINGQGKRRMDVVWAAWRVFCLKEMPGKFGLSLKPIKGVSANGHAINFGANPPYVGDLSTWLSHPEEHRAAEFGWNLETLEANRTGRWNGVLVGERPKSYKAVSHAGHPSGIGHLTEREANDDDPFPVAKFGKWKVGNLMEFATLSGDENLDSRFRNKNLYQIWWRQGLSQADPDFPWVDSDFAARKAAADEAPSGMVGYWFLQRGRALSILKENLGVPELRGLTAVSYVAKLRNWDKLGMISPGKFMDNPVFVKILSDIKFYKGITAGNMENYRTGKSVSELEYSATDPNEWLSKAEGGQDWKGINFISYIYNAMQSGLIDFNEFKSLHDLKPRS